MTSPRVLLSGGGTGDIFFRRFLLLRNSKRFPDAEFMFIGALGKMEMEKVPQAGFKIEGLILQVSTEVIFYQTLNCHSDY